jgi:hypothetical protein
MSKLTVVKDAKALMTEAMDWSVFKWLWEKSNVRQTADDANAALDRLNKKTKAQWGEELKAAYRQIVADDGRNKRSHHEKTSFSTDADPQILQSLRTVKGMDDKAHAARMDAEATFDEAERHLSTDLAREGCRKAIRSWELHEKAIRAAEALVSSTKESHSA